MSVVKRILIRAFFIFQAFLLAKVLAWAIMVAGPYMEASHLEMRCNKFLAGYYLNEFAKEHKLTPTTPTCPFDEESCDKSDEAWKAYEEKLVRYKSYRWFW